MSYMFKENSELRVLASRLCTLQFPADVFRFLSRPLLPGWKDCAASTRASVIVNALSECVRGHTHTPRGALFTAWYPAILTSWRVSFWPVGLWGGKLGCGPSILSWAFPSVSNTEETQKICEVNHLCVSVCTRSCVCVENSTVPRRWSIDWERTDAASWCTPPLSCLRTKGLLELNRGTATGTLRRYLKHSRNTL